MMLGIAEVNYGIYISICPSSSSVTRTIMYFYSYLKLAEILLLCYIGRRQMK